MSRGYEAPGVDVFEKEELPEYNPPTNTVYGVIGATVAGPFVPVSISSIKQLHNVFGYAYLGKDDNGKRIISQAITAAERILENTSTVVFCRAGLADSEVAKFKRTSETGLSFTIANNDTSVKSITVTGDGTAVTVKAEKITRYGDIVTSVLASGITSEATLKTALEYEGTLTDVKANAGYIATIKTDSTDTYIPSFNALKIKIGNEFGYFENVDTMDVSVVIAPMGTVIESTVFGKDVISYDSVNSKLLEVQANRKDCMVLYDYPIDLGYDAACTLFGGTSYTGIDCDQLAMCYPAIKVKNQYTGDIIEASSSMIISKQMAYTDSKKECWFAPAGFGDSRGVITDVVSVNAALTRDMRNKIYGYRVNPVVTFIGQGTVLFGNRTFKSTNQYEQDSYFTNINVRRLVNYVKKLVNYVSISTLFNPNDSITWKNWTNTISPKLRVIQQNRGLEAYKVIMDNTTISADDILNGRAPAVIYVKPITAIEYIPVSFVLTSDSVVFEEDEEA